MTTQTLSFYVPRMRSTWSESQIIAALYNTFGVVDRVDFGDIVTTNIRYAFVHMSLMNPFYSEEIDTAIQLNGHFRLQVTHDEFWMFIPNKKPVQKTHLNIHQLAEIASKLESRVASLEAEIASLRGPPLPIGKREFVPATFFDLDEGVAIESDMESTYLRWQEVGIEAQDEYADMPALIPNDEN